MGGVRESQRASNVPKDCPSIPKGAMLQVRSQVVRGEGKIDHRRRDENTSNICEHLRTSFRGEYHDGAADLVYEEGEEYSEEEKLSPDCGLLFSTPRKVSL
jgi:hypothetical protein